MTVPYDIISRPPAEFCRMTGIGLTKLYEMLKKGELQSVTIGKRRLILLDSWRNYVSEHLGAPSATKETWKPPRPRARHAIGG
jgi:excisionase family DNA binding protein